MILLVTTGSQCWAIPGWSVVAVALLLTAPRLLERYLTLRGAEKRRDA